VLPYRFYIFGSRVDIWEVTLLLGVVAGYLVLVAAFKVGGESGAAPRLLVLRYLFSVYVAVVGAQLFSYAFDMHTTLAPPRGYSWVRYYLNPLSGAKTLYGAVVALPIAVLAVSTPWRDLGFGRALERWTPALFTVLSVARLGCLAQGCCYGVRSQGLGLRFAPGSVVYYQQLSAGLIDEGSWSLAVVPTQAISAVVIAAIGVAYYRALLCGRRYVFVGAIALYSVFRFLIEMVRDDVVRNYYGPLSTSQWLALAILAGCVVWRWLELEGPQYPRAGGGRL